MASRSRAACAVYLECLESHILEGKLQDAPVQLIQQYMQHLADEGLYSSIEASITQLPVDRLDLHQVKSVILAKQIASFQVLSICRQQQLWDGIICVHNRALLDYVGPLKVSIIFCVKWID